MTQLSASLSPETIYGELKKNGVTHIVMLPDSETNFLYLVMKADPELTILHVAREGQSFSTAAGISVGGKRPVVLIQNTGLLESCDSLRGWGMGLKTPVVIIIGYRGWTRHGVNPPTDVANFTEPILHALGIHYFLVENDADAPRISLAFQEAEQTRRPVAVLVGDEYHGFVNR
jgi:sulfopyruvate decarboxylase TPP-binding subunit